MPEHSFTAEAEYLARIYPELAQYDGMWVAVNGETIVDSDTDPVALALRVRGEHGDAYALFAAVVLNRIA